MTLKGVNDRDGALSATMQVNLDFGDNHTIAVLVDPPGRGHQGLRRQQLRRQPADTEGRRHNERRPKHGEG